MKKFVSFHPVYACHQTFFSRDFGQIGLTFYKEKGFTPETWSLKKRGWESFRKEGQYWRGFRFKTTMFFRLLFFARTIDVLHMYHIYKSSFFGALCYRITNWSGKIYIKMDTPLYFKKNDFRKSFSKIPKLFLVLFFRLVSFVGFEDKKLLSFFQETFPKYKNKFVLTTSGGVVLDKFINNLIKKNRISLCGRFGSPEKNYEMFLNMLKYEDIGFLNGWDIYFIGSATKDFEKLVENLLIAKPALEGRIHITGFLTDKESVYEIMSESKIFLHTSTREGDPNIQYDAMFCGCYMISTDVANIKQNYPNVAASFYRIKDVSGLHNTLKKGIIDVADFKNDDFLGVQKYFLQHFTWSKALSEVLDKI